MAVMSPVCAAICSDPAYISALGDKGVLLSATIQYGGRAYTHDDIVSICEQSYLRHRNEYTTGAGATRRLERRNARKLRNAVMADVGTYFGLSPWRVILDLAAGWFTGGPLGLVFAIASIWLDWYTSRDLAGNSIIAAMAGA